VAQLQRPEIAYMNGKLVQWDQAVLHVGSEAVIRGLNVFEGVKAYWQPDRSLKIAMARQHYLRLCRSARLLHMPCAVTYEEYVSAIDQLIGALVKPDRDM